MHRALGLSESALTDFCQANHIRRLSLFGSQLKSTAGAESDVDLLVEFDAQYVPTLFAMARMEQALSDMIGRSVDLRTAGDLSRYFRHEVLRTAEVQYAA